MVALFRYLLSTLSLDDARPSNGRDMETKLNYFTTLPRNFSLESSKRIIGVSWGGLTERWYHSGDDDIVSVVHVPKGRLCIRSVDRSNGTRILQPELSTCNIWYLWQYNMQVPKIYFT